MRVRRAEAADIPAILSIELESPTASHWSRQQYEEIFAASTGEQLSARLAWIVEDGATPPVTLGFLVARRMDKEWELENLAIAGTARRQGLGRLLLSHLVSHVAIERGAHIHLEVRVSNVAARALYRKAGFVESGLRRSYYKNPAEDAVLYRLEIAHFS